MIVFLVVLFNAIAAAGIQLIITHFDGLGLLFSFLLSLVTYVVIGVSYYFKDKCDPSTGFIYYIGIILAAVATFGLLYPALGSFSALWKASTTFWLKAFLVWMALQALTMIWVVFKKPEE
jgi:hypothetical protein